jgi:hypothetical protein
MEEGKAYTWRPAPCRGGGRGSQLSAHPQTAPPLWDPLGCKFVITLNNSNNNLLLVYIKVCRTKNYMENICIALTDYFTMSVFLSD